MSGEVLYGILNCFIALGIACYAMYMLGRCEHAYKRLCVLPIFTSISYIILELEWILSKRYESIGEVADFAWLACEAGWMISILVILRTLAGSTQFCRKCSRDQ